MNLKHQLLYTASVWLLLLAFLGLSEPSKLPVVMLIVPFLLLFSALYSLWGLLQQAGVRYFGRGRIGRRLRMTVCISAVLLLVLQSLGQLSVRDVVTVMAIVVVGYLYLGRTSLSVNRQ